MNRNQAIALLCSWNRSEGDFAEDEVTEAQAMVRVDPSIIYEVLQRRCESLFQGEKGGKAYPSFLMKEVEKDRVKRN